jgi:cob(I)alamin adenosyltransferase
VPDDRSPVTDGEVPAGGATAGDAAPRPSWFTRRGDDGYTALLGPGRVPKYDPRPEAYGAVDEAQAALGLARAAGCAAQSGPILLAVQRDLSALMAELAAAGMDDSPFAGRITTAHVAQLEAWLREVETQVQMPREFVIPGGSLPGAALHLARTVVRRAERRVARLRHTGLLANDHVLRYLNRLSSLLFVLACLEDQGARPLSLEGEVG